MHVVSIWFDSIIAAVEFRETRYFARDSRIVKFATANKRVKCALNAQLSLCMSESLFRACTRSLRNAAAFSRTHRMTTDGAIDRN